MTTLNGKEDKDPNFVNLTSQMYENNSGCCGEDEIPSEELTPNQIHKNKNGFRVKGEVKIRGRRTDKVIILPEDRYIYTATGNGFPNENYPLEYYHNSSTSETSSTIKTLFGDVIRKFINRPSMIEKKEISDVLAGDLINESDEETTLNESFNKIYDYTSVKTSEMTEGRSKNPMKNKLRNLTSCFGKSNYQLNPILATENFEMVVEEQCFLEALSDWRSRKAKFTVQGTHLNSAKKFVLKINENGGDGKNQDLTQKTKLKKKNNFEEQSNKYPSIKQFNVIPRSNEKISLKLNKSSPVYQRISKIPVILKSMKTNEKNDTKENISKQLSNKILNKNSIKNQKSNTKIENTKGILKSIRENSNLIKEYNSGGNALEIHFGENQNNKDICNNNL